MKVNEVIRRLEAEGRVISRRKASHRTFKKVGVPEVVTVSDTDGKDVTPGQLQDIKRKAGWKS